VRSLFEEIIELVGHDLPVLIAGETGTGKELVARALHDMSPRHGEPFEPVNCAAIPRDLVASILFGHERGAFTGAISPAKGAFERAGRGTLFLDEIGDMPLETQATLLRVLQGRTFQPVGGDRWRPVMARVLSATNRDLAPAVRKGTFRPDLFYRIHMYCLRIPPLRERMEDIPEIVEHILARNPARGHVRTASVAFLDALGKRAYPGNVRELEGLVLGAAVRSRGRRELLPEDLEPPAADDDASYGESDPIRPGSGSVPGYEEMERRYILSILRHTGGNKKQAAALMKIPRTTLNARLRKLGLAASGDHPRSETP
jgi:DNA-binding NtrC family response regulator